MGLPCIGTPGANGMFGGDMMPPCGTAVGGIAPGSPPGMTFMLLNCTMSRGILAPIICLATAALGGGIEL